MATVRLLALDLDDTLLRPDFSVSHRTKTALRKAETRGVVVVLATNSTPAALRQFSAQLRLNKKSGYQIANSGAVVLEKRSGEILFEQKIPAEAALLVFDMADAEGFAVQIHDNDTLYISRANEFTGCDQKLTGRKQVIAKDFRSMIADGCHKMLIPGDPMILEPLAKLLGNLSDDAAIQATMPYLLEVLPAGVNKGSALVFVAEKCGITREEAMAVSMRDGSMLRWAGSSQTMSDEDGVAALIERRILKNETKAESAE
jgi:Cof subfamily protein (haloacid dehalogenase superfamily)